MHTCHYNPCQLYKHRSRSTSTSITINFFSYYSCSSVPASTSSERHHHRYQGYHQLYVTNSTWSISRKKSWQLSITLCWLQIKRGRTQALWTICRTQAMQVRDDSAYSSPEHSGRFHVEYLGRRSRRLYGISFMPASQWIFIADQNPKSRVSSIRFSISRVPLHRHRFTCTQLFHATYFLATNPDALAFLQLVYLWAHMSSRTATDPFLS